MRAIPIERGRPTSSRTRSRSVVAMAVGVPAERAKPRTSRNASSMLMPSTSGVVSSKIAKTALLAFV